MVLPICFVTMDFKLLQNIGKKIKKIKELDNPESASVNKSAIGGGVSMEILILVLVALAMLAIGVPIGIALCCGLLALSFSYGTIDVSFISQAMYTGQESLPILAVPCFMLAGDLMLRVG